MADNTQSVLRRLRELYENPRLSLEQIADNIQNFNKGRKAEINDRGAGYRTLTPKERTAQIVGGALENIGGGGMGALGMIRRGGDPALNMVHNMTGGLNKLDQLLMSRKAISNPSVAITKDNVFPFAETPTLVFNPQSHAFDPATAKANELFATDAYTHRAKNLKDLRRVQGDIPEYSRDLRFTEGGGPDEPGHFMSVLASPKFGSFKQFEKSRHGAQRLGPLTEMDQRYSEMLANEYKGWLREQPGHDLGGPRSESIRDYRNFEYLRDKARKGDETAKFLLEGFRTLPSEYAELKVTGELPLNKSTVSGVILPSSWKPSEASYYGKEWSDALGVPVGQPVSLIPEHMQGTYRDLVGALTNSVQNQLRKIDEGKFIVGDAYEQLPANVRKYVDENTWDYTLGRSNPEEIRDVIMQGTVNSKGLASDVASMLTAVPKAKGGLVQMKECR